MSLSLQQFKLYPQLFEDRLLWSTTIRNSTGVRNFLLFCNPPLEGVSACVGEISFLSSFFPLTIFVVYGLTSTTLPQKTTTQKIANSVALQGLIIKIGLFKHNRL